MSAHLEKTMEDEVTQYLAEHGWLYSPDDTGYDRELAFFPQDVIGWLEDTQPDELAKVLPDLTDDSARAKFLKAIAQLLDTPVANGGGTLSVLRKQQHIGRGKFTFAVAKPADSLNPTITEWYAKIRLRVMRQVHYSVSRPNRSIDLVLFANGFPVATIELKTDFTQSLVQGEAQYGKSRQPTDPGTSKPEPLLSWGRRALVYFVVTNEVVSMTTKLAGKSTVFLPFNRGHDEGAGNPPDPRGSRTEYFWREVLDRDQWLKILMRFMLVKKERKIDPATGKESTTTSIRFPRFHQLDAVEKIVADVEEHGPGQKYLIEHSAGSGKTDTIVWTAQRLAALHDQENAKVFNSVIVVTDRTVLDDQISNAMMQLDMRRGQVVSIDSDSGPKSEAFLNAINARTPIIVVTIQTAPFALEKLKDASAELGGRYAVIADEAHSSQTGNAAATLREVLGPEIEDGEEGAVVGADDLLAAAMTQRADASNISYLAFTATPKAKTMELFGRKNPQTDGPEPFHRYSMRQAIQEGYILNVLQNYTTYDVAVKLAGEAIRNEVVDEEAAKKATRQWVELHPYNISQKVRIIVEHFREHVAGRLGGNAKAMVVCASRKEAVRFHHALNTYISAHGLKDMAALVAFSGSVVDEELYGEDAVTEASLNPGAGGRPLNRVFNGPDYQVLIVANKFQVGFDQPLLCAMYVNKPLSGVMAVQTLSRLNRSYRGKSAEDVFVLDFINSTATIADSFAPYYRGAVLAEESDVNLVHRLASKLDQSGLYDLDDVEAVWAASISGSNRALHQPLQEPVDEFNRRVAQAELAGNDGELDRLEEFRGDLSNYVRVYRFMSLIFDYGDLLLAKRAVFYEAFAELLAVPPNTVEVDLSDLEMTHHRIDDLGSESVILEKVKPTPLTGMLAVGTAELRETKNEQWREILDALNRLFGGIGLTDEDLVRVFDPALRKMRENKYIVDVAYANTEADFANSSDALEGLVDALVSTSEDTQKVTERLLSTADRTDLARLIKALRLQEFLQAG